MNMKNEYKVTKELIMSWAKEYHLHGIANKVAFALCCGIIVFSVILLVLSSRLSDWLCGYIGVLGLVFAVFRLFVARFIIWSNRYKLFSKTYGVTEWMRTIEFTDEDIVMTDHNSVSHFKYENIESIKEKGNVVMLYCNHNISIRLYKDAFIAGTWEECQEMVLQKMQK